MKIIHIHANNATDFDSLQKIRKCFYRSLFGEGAKDVGEIGKFNNSIGFKPVVDDFNDWPIIHPAKVDSPDDYQAPQHYLMSVLYPVFDQGSEIAKFCISKGKEHHPDANFVYGHYQIAEKFISFLRKVYPDFDIAVEDTDCKFDPDIVERNQAYFYMNLALIDDASYTIECAADGILTKAQLRRFYHGLKDVVPFKWHLTQFFCETCKKYHPDAPYHTEVVFEE